MKKIFPFVTYLLLVFSSMCLAQSLPDYEFSLGGISVKGTATIDYVKSIYGEPSLISKDNYSATYRYGSTVTIKTHTFDNERVFYIETTDNNGFATPSGLAVGMKKKDMLNLYGSPRSISKDGFNRECFIYGDKYASGGAGMYISINKENTIVAIKLIN